MTLNKKILIQETNLDDLNEHDDSDIKNNSQIGPVTIYVYGNNTFYSDFENTYYSEPCATEPILDQCSNTTRRDMFDYLIKYFTNYDGNFNNTPEMCRFLAKEMHCNCSDCGGNDSVGHCEIENEYYKHFENIVEYNDL